MKTNLTTLLINETSTPATVQERKPFIIRNATITGFKPSTDGAPTTVYFTYAGKYGEANGRAVAHPALRIREHMHKAIDLTIKERIANGKREWVLLNPKASSEEILAHTLAKQAACFEEIELTEEDAAYANSF